MAVSKEPPFLMEPQIDEREGDPKVQVVLFF